ncbi:MAG: DUF2282 domain-containing protein [Gammaproteobacteria bacterium]|nr:DUF2282 domain-containing protein [Gammaproteobacteria bacterium]
MNTLTASAVSALVAFGLGAAPAMAEDKPEKCYGIVKAAKNDCQTTNNACASHSGSDNQGDAWIYLPKGTCEKIVGGGLAAK